MVIARRPSSVSLKNNTCNIITRTSTSRSTSNATSTTSLVGSRVTSDVVSLSAATGVVVADTAPDRINVKSIIRDYWKLSKGGLSVYAALSALPGYLVSCGLLDGISGVLLGSAGVFSGTLLCAASSQVINQMMEKGRDANMARTKNRPLPTGRITMAQAGMFAGVTCSVGTAILFNVGGPMPAVVALSTSALYTMVYTPMKVKSPYNTHVGSIAGSLPVLIGFSVAGVPLFGDLAPWTLFLLQTLWQFPHFYALAWLFRVDYSRAGYRMFPLTDETGHETAAMCRPYMMALAALPVAASALGVTSWMFAFSGMVPNLVYYRYGFARFSKSPSGASARRYFLHSVWYLGAMMGLFVLHAQRPHSKDEDKDLDGRGSWFSHEIDFADWRTEFRAKIEKKWCIHDWLKFDPTVARELCPPRPAGIFVSR
ncbi:Protoheme IX farnesyltransferase, mitochondrial [Perkinsus olseni]|uniref:Heme O synthase n=1 Tax=Perkinsus olseni TaxID=32597 RepID=A0A7J6MPP0_PEROL|nr:Protoheme IX farnesyltransferase, mitochondrial [Perkinsus olseni]